MFIHGDNGHLRANLVGLMTAALPVYHSLGRFFVYIGFIGGGIFAALPSPMQSAQLQREQREVRRSIDALTSGSTIGALAKPFLTTGANFFQMVASGNQRCCGSSGAVCSLWGLSTALLVDEVVTFMKGRQRESRNQLSLLSMIKSTDIRESIMKIVPFVIYICSEYNHVFGTSDKGIIEAVLGGTSQRIGHAAHLQGAVFGASLGAAIILVRNRTRHEQYSETRQACEKAKEAGGG